VPPAGGRLARGLAMPSSKEEARAVRVSRGEGLGTTGLPLRVTGPGNMSSLRLDAHATRVAALPDAITSPRWCCSGRSKMISTHVLQRGGQGARSPMDLL
jgi:hypothetical protein